MGDERQSTVKFPEAPASERLESWKEIANYLKRGVSTVQRWEKQEGLPVHRHLHDKLGTVYAYKSEIDAWLNHRQTWLEQHEPRSWIVDRGSWIVDRITGHESRVTNHESRTTSAATRRSTLWLMACALGLILLAVLTMAAYFARERFWPTAQSPAGRIMLAVLPFQNLSGDPDQDPFADGMTEEMIGQLGRLHAERLGVIARTSVMRYKVTDRDVDQIGRELGVAYILEGSVRREGDRVRLHAQLIRVNDRTSLWAETYERDVQSVLALQTDIAERIARSLMIELVPARQASPAQTSTTNPDAHQDYLKGRYWFNKVTLEGLLKSRQYFQQAVEKDPHYALAYAGLADAYNLLGSYGALSPQDTFPQAKVAASRALELDGQLAEAHTALALTTLYYDWDWPGAESRFRRAINLSPGYSTAHHWYAWCLSLMGLHDEALTEVKLALELDPLSPQLNADVGSFYYRARRYDEAIAQYRRTLDLEPDFPGARAGLMKVYWQKGMYQEALAEIQKVMLHSGASPEEVAALGHADAIRGIRTFVQSRLQKLQERATKEYTPPVIFAEIYTVLGEKDQALEWLEKAYAEHSQALVFLKVEPAFDPLRSDPRFQELLRRVGLPW